MVPLLECYRCKLDKDGLIDKLKCRIVFRGDLYDPADPQDPWNPHASFLALKVFLAICARYGIFPAQVDFLLAFLQADMRERVFVEFPDAWKNFLPEHLWKWIGRPLKLRKALYGYNYSGKFLYQDQAEFLESEGFLPSGLPGLWYKRYPGDRLIMFLHYVDDILIASNDPQVQAFFIESLKGRFDIEVKPSADWYLQTHLQQDKNKNITLDQTRYSKSMVARFLPNASSQLTEDERKRYASPLKTTTRLIKEDSSSDEHEVQALEEEYGFRFIELAGCFNWISYTCYEEIYAIRKLCKFMARPGRKHFQAALHLLHHFRCHPPKPLIFYHNLRHAPVMSMIKDIPGLVDIDLSYLTFADSAHADCDDGRSTGCDLQVFQGGLIDHISWIPNPIPQSSAESESNCYSAAIMRSRFPLQAIAKILYGQDASVWTIPVFVDSSAAIVMNSSDRVSPKTRHIQGRYWYGRTL